jgi:glucose/mannose-6-phosphate isomerase
MSPVSLDDPGLRSRLDPDGSYERIRDLPEQCGEAWHQSGDLKLPNGYRDVDKLVVIGMGGSAIAADHLQALAYPESRVPITVVRGYSLPAWVDSRTLVIACSHSGNTEEVLTAFDQAVAGPAKTFVVTTGGRLAELAASKGIPLLQYSYPNVPRDAFGHGYVRLLAVANALGLVSVDDGRISAVVATMKAQREGIAFEVAESANAAKKVARLLEDRMPLTVGAEFMTPVARRWRTQMDENADVFAMWDELPELNHNLVVGLRHQADLLRRTQAVFIDHADLNGRVRLRYELTVQMFQNAGIACERVAFPQRDRLAAQLCAVHFGDLVSYYLAMLKGTRPVEIENINWLKDQLASRK